MLNCKHAMQAVPALYTRDLDVQDSNPALCNELRPPPTPSSASPFVKFIMASPVSATVLQSRKKRRKKEKKNGSLVGLYYRRAHIRLAEKVVMASSLQILPTLKTDLSEDVSHEKPRSLILEDQNY